MRKLVSVSALVRLKTARLAGMTMELAAATVGRSDRLLLDRRWEGDRWPLSTCQCQLPVLGSMLRAAGMDSHGLDTGRQCRISKRVVRQNCASSLALELSLSNEKGSFCNELCQQVRYNKKGNCALCYFKVALSGCSTIM